MQQNTARYRIKTVACGFVGGGSNYGHVVDRDGDEFPAVVAGFGEQVEVTILC